LQGGDDRLLLAGHAKFVGDLQTMLPAQLVGTMPALLPDKAAVEVLLSWCVRVA
jgi:hypothetical protein